MSLVTRYTRAGVIAVACAAFCVLALRSPWARGMYAALDGAPLSGAVAGVVRGDDRHAIAGATVCARCITCPAAQEATACATTDRAGAYEIRELPYGGYVVAAWASGYAAAAAPGPRVLLASARVPVPEITAPRGGARIAGTVLDAMGAPVANARVRVTHADPPRFVLDVTSDAGGAFELAMPQGPFEIAAHKKGYAPANGHGVAPAQHVRLVLEPAFVLRGRVATARGEAIPGAVVRAVPRDRMPRLAWAKSDADGDFTFSSLPAGGYFIVASGAGTYGELPYPVELGATRAAEPIALEVYRAIALHGRVVLEDGAPCPEGYVLLGEPDPAQAPIANDDDATDSQLSIGPEQHAIIEHDGAVRFGGVPPARYFASVHCAGHALAAGPQVLELPRDAQRELTWVVRPATKLIAFATDASGRAAAHARIAISWQGRDGRRAIMPALTDAHGNAEIAGPRCGDCQLLAGDNVGSGASVPFQLHDGGARGEARLVLDGDAVLELDVRDHEGSPIDGLQVTARRADGIASRYVATALGDGRYRFAAVAAGPYAITGDDGINPAQPLWGTAAMPVEVEAGAQLQWRAVLERSAVVAGRVLDDTGRPVHGAWVSVQPAIDHGSEPAFSMMSSHVQRTLTGHDGRFAIDRLAPGARLQLRGVHSASEEAQLLVRAPQRDVLLTLVPR